MLEKLKNFVKDIRYYMNTKRQLDVLSNPLVFEELESNVGSINYENVLRFFCKSGKTADLNNIKMLYNEISKEEDKISIAPKNEEILRNIIRPLQYAKSSYCCENYLGTIALCGMVAEMLSILRFQTIDIPINNYPIAQNKENQKNVFGGEFERLGQERRVGILFAFGTIDEKDKRDFDFIRERRRKYLHLYSFKHDAIKGDALKVYSATTSLLAGLIGSDGELRPEMKSHLMRLQKVNRIVDSWKDS